MIAQNVLPGSTCTNTLNPIDCNDSHFQSRLPMWIDLAHFFPTGPCYSSSAGRPQTWKRPQRIRYARCHPVMPLRSVESRAMWKSLSAGGHFQTWLQTGWQHSRQQMSQVFQYDFNRESCLLSQTHEMGHGTWRLFWDNYTCRIPVIIILLIKL